MREINGTENEDFKANAEFAQSLEHRNDDDDDGDDLYNYDNLPTIIDVLILLFLIVGTWLWYFVLNIIDILGCILNVFLIVIEIVGICFNICFRTLKFLVSIKSISIYMKR